jgi:transposase
VAGAAEGARGLAKAVVALANKNARILWAVLTRGAPFNPEHVPEPPAARCCLKPHPAA